MVNTLTRGARLPKREPKPLGVRNEAEAEALRYVALKRIMDRRDELVQVGEREYVFCPLAER
ncbi:MAG: hypothetical protein IJ849_01965 [Selenomonadaceae bacterium]|nr:hypothetical protein [Selenomonadaceae bacterium]